MAAKQRRKNPKDRLTAWQEQNPLRLWRLKQHPEGWNRSVLARQLKVSHTAVGTWERGERLPVIDAFARIERLTGINTMQWMQWFEQKPKEK